MKTSLRWLARYVAVPGDYRDLTERLTLAGLEVEGIEQKTVPDGVVVARVLERNPHPDADKLSVCKVDAGTGAHLQVVCGAPNCDAGAVVPLATVGTEFPGGFKIKKAKLRGVESFGMLCSSSELGLDDDHSGLLHLPQDAPVGTELRDYLDTDVVVDWEVTPNRPDWLSHIGIAREVAAVYNCRDSFRLPDAELNETDEACVTDATSVDVQAPDLCPRYIARVIRNVTIAPSPGWMQDCLRAVGIRPISNVVDITNFVLMECGHPLHAFDYDKLAGNRVVVRRAGAGEKMATLDGQVHELGTENLLIADAEKGVALAGVMGGENSEISDTTTTVLLESAVFNPPNIRATAKALGISTDSSYRFERGVGFDMAEYASRRAASLICELAGGELLRGSIDACASHYAPHHVSCRVERATRLLGVPLDSPALTDCFERLGLDIADQNAEQVTVAVPSFRLDLYREVDLIEEVARIYGLSNIAGVPAAAQLGGPIAADAYLPIQAAREELLALGLDEAMNYSLFSETQTTGVTDVQPAELIKLSNPISAEASCLRPTLLPGMLQTLAWNIAHDNHNLQTFEIGRVFVNRDGFPEERLQACIVLTGRVQPGRFAAEREQALDFYDLKGVLSDWLAARRVQGVACNVATHPAFRKGQCAELSVNGTTLAVFGVLAKDLTQDMRLKHDALMALVELDQLLAIAGKPKVYEPLPLFPGTSRDISLVAPASLANQELVDAIAAMNSKWIQSVQLTDVFEDPKVLGEGKQGRTYSVTYRDPNSTLTDEKVNQAHDKVRSRLKQQFPIEYR